MSQPPNTTGTPAVRRRSQRVLMQVAVRVRGKDSQGNAFEEETETLAINAHGAFYRAQGNAVKVIPEGGPVHVDGTRMLTVGAYRGDTLPAQMVTLLHEFGHIIDLLPEDADNLDGKSVRNTDEVLRHCRAAVEARSQLANSKTAKR